MDSGCKAPAVSVGEFEAIVQKARELLSVATSLDEYAGSVSDRYLGPEPPIPSTSTEACDEVSNTLSEIMRDLQAQTQRHLQRAHDAVTRLGTAWNG